MKVKLWGVRGSIPTPVDTETIENKIIKSLTFARPGDISSEESVRAFVKSLPLYIRGTYGGNTTCIEVRTESGELIIIDCGSGLMHLGKTLMSEGYGKGTGIANIFLTHTHWDHIQGIPFFTPFYIRGNKFNIYSPMEDIEKRIEYQQADTHFPINFDKMQSTKRFFKVKTDEYFFINDVKIYTKLMPHPGNAYGIRIEEGNSVFVYTSDCEFSINEIDKIDDYTPLFLNADVVLFDAQYTFHESMIDKISWGHSSASIAIDIANKYDVKKLVLFHHDPNYDDEKLNSVISNARTYLNVNKKMKSDLDVDLATEGMSFEF